MLVSKLIKKSCLVPPERASTMQFRMAKTMSFCSRFHRGKAQPWSERGSRSSRTCGSLASAGCSQGPGNVDRLRAVVPCSVDTFISNSVIETERAGERLAGELRAGSVLALKGDLGSGKTHFTKG